MVADETGCRTRTLVNICILLQDKWSPVHSISTILTSIQSLLTDPNVKVGCRTIRLRPWRIRADPNALIPDGRRRPHTARPSQPVHCKVTLHRRSVP